ncbi:molybdate ABC transporter substrate-binding protein [Glycomyces harbinensis]|uniref:Molybdate transport system substrate-binding protein n=1 Tax=Glycomyces harbinensis TaxID=58114 RepID=A0A1G6QWR1_9ACTN|nr:substrate-binding domain-containing protein [Glycomyces harbinensis]SDC96424.1 molybdate transport system substrate-binding protein [Glycomyces harbinensis]
MTIRLFSTLAVRLALDEGVTDGFVRATGHGVETVYDPTNVLLRRIAGGDLPDVMIGVRSQLDGLAEDGLLDGSTLTEIARVGVGIAAAPDTGALPNISTVDDLKETLLGARSVAYSRTGASGVYFASLLERLGIDEAVNARATVVEKGFTAEAVLDGRADLAVQQLSELRFVPRARLVGPLPEGAQHYTVFAAAVGAEAEDRDAARGLVAHLAAEDAVGRYRAAGLEAA